MSNDYKIKDEEFWYEPLDDFQSYGKIVVVEISEVDLLNENAEGLKEKGVGVTGSGNKPLNVSMSTPTFTGVTPLPGFASIASIVA